MPGYYEVHCHILPGVDDGAGDMKETVRMLEEYHNDGVRTIYATSHYRKGMFEPSMKEVQRQFERVKARAREIGSGITVYLGCEFTRIWIWWRCWTRACGPPWGIAAVC